MSKKCVTVKKDVFCEDKGGIVKIHTKDRSYDILSKTSGSRGNSVAIITDVSGRHILLVDSNYFKQNFKISEKAERQ
jgi:hypothetical protein